MSGKLCLVVLTLAVFGAAAVLGCGKSSSGGHVDGSTGTGEDRAWPNVVGMTGEEAKAIIERDDPSLTVQIVPYGHFVTEDYRTDRVWIFLNIEGKVDRPPRIG